MTAIRLAVAGARGRMGRHVLRLAAQDEAFSVVQALEFEEHALIGRSLADVDPGFTMVTLETDLAEGADVLVDFSTAASSPRHARRARELGTALVVGTTGLSPEQQAELDEAAKDIAVLQAPNFSLGVNLLFRLVGEVAKALRDDFDIEIVETHHNQKADAPSGTALGLARSICEARGLDMDETLVHGRHGRPGPRTKTEIGMHALRLGSVVGDHTVHFGSPYERLELTHRAESRVVFAAGALRAAKWLAGKPAGRYSMNDVLFGEGR